MAVFPAPAVDEVTVTSLFLSPVVVPITSKEKEQKGSAVVRLAPFRLMVLEPAVAMIVPPKQLPIRLLGVATTNPGGRLSEKLTPSSVVPVFGLLIPKVRVVLPLVRMEAAENALLMTGGTAVTVRLEAP